MADISKIKINSTEYDLKARALASDAGSATQPVYIKNGVPTATTYTLGKTVPSNAVFTDTDTKASQTNTTTAGEYRILMSANANDTTESSLTRKSSSFIANPGTGEFFAKGFRRIDISGQTLDINTLNLSSGTPNMARYINKTNGGAANITNIPVTNLPFLLDVDVIRWASTTDYVTRQIFTNAVNGDKQYVRYCTNGTWSAWVTRVFTNTTYSVMGAASASAAGKSGLVPAPGAGSQGNFLRGDGVWAQPASAAAMTGATSSAAGKTGLVPAPTAGKQTSFLRGDGTWVVPTNTTYSVMTAATASAAGKAGLVPAPTAGSTTKCLLGNATWGYTTSIQDSNSSVTVNREASNGPQVEIKSVYVTTTATGPVQITTPSFLVDATAGGITLKGGQGMNLQTTKGPINITTSGSAAQTGSLNVHTVSDINLKADTENIKIAADNYLRGYPATSTTTTYPITGMDSNTSNIGVILGSTNVPTRINGAMVQINGKYPTLQSTSSDRNLKEEITSLSDNYDTLFDKLEPVTFKYTNGESGRTHIGFISQDVETAVYESGLDNMSCAAVNIVPFKDEEVETIYDADSDSTIENPKSNKNTLLKKGIKQEYCLNYQEFIGLLVDQVQKLKKSNKDLEERIKILEAK